MVDTKVPLSSICHNYNLYITLRCETVSVAAKASTATDSRPPPRSIGQRRRPGRPRLVRLHHPWQHPGSGSFSGKSLHGQPHRLRLPPQPRRPTGPRWPPCWWHHFPSWLSVTSIASRAHCKADSNSYSGLKAFQLKIIKPWEVILCFKSMQIFKTILEDWNSLKKQSWKIERKGS